MGHSTRGILTLPTFKCDPINGMCFNKLYYKSPLDINVQTITLLQQFSQHNFLYYNHGIVPEEFSWILVKPIFRENSIK